jgi:hypothetical protein
MGQGEHPAPRPRVSGNGANVISCTSPGNCVAGAPFISIGPGTASVVSQVHGVWGKVQAIRGLATRTGLSLLAR